MAINTRVAYALLKLSSNSRIRIDFRSISTGDINYSSVSIVSPHHPTFEVLMSPRICCPCNTCFVVLVQFFSHSGLRLISSLQFLHVHSFLICFNSTETQPTQRASTHELTTPVDPSTAERCPAVMPWSKIKMPWNVSESLQLVRSV